MSISVPEPSSPVREAQFLLTHRESQVSNRESEGSSPDLPHHTRKSPFELSPEALEIPLSARETGRRPEHRTVSTGLESERAPEAGVKTGTVVGKWLWGVVPVLCLMTVGGMLGYAVQWGDWDRLGSGADVYGNLCGGKGLEGRRYAYFPDPVQSTDVVYCVEGCPLTVTVEAVCGYTADLQVDYSHVCFDSYPSKPYFNHYCLPADSTLRRTVLDKLTSTNFSTTLLFSDVIQAPST